MVSSFTTNKNIEKPASGDYPGAWAAPINANWDLIDSALGATLNLGLSNVNVTLSRVQAGNLIIKLTGTLTGNVTITFPAFGGIWVVSNETTGAFTVTLACAGGGATVAAQQSARTILMTDGTNARIADDRAGSGSFNSAAFDSLFGSTRGNLIYRGAGGWVALGPGTSGNFLKTNGAGADPSWAAAGAGTVTSVGSGSGLTGGPITGSGTLNIGAGTGITVNTDDIAVTMPIRAWGRVDPVSPSLLASGNVASVARPSTGVYTITFSSAMPDANYAVLVSLNYQTNNGAPVYAFYINPTTTTVQIVTRWTTTSGVTDTALTNVLPFSFIVVR